MKEAMFHQVAVGTLNTAPSRTVVVTVVLDQVDKVHRGNVEKDVFEIKQSCKPNCPPKVLTLREEEIGVEQN